MAFKQLKDIHKFIATLVILSFGFGFAGHKYIYNAAASAWFWENRNTIVNSVKTQTVYDSFIPTGPPIPTYKVGPPGSNEDSEIMNYGLIK